VASGTHTSHCDRLVKCAGENVDEIALIDNDQQQPNPVFDVSISSQSTFS
jgi:hypothetical protein